MKGINSRDSLLISGLMHIMIAGIIFLLLKQEYKVVREIDISFLFNSNEKEIQYQKLKDIQPPKKTMKRHLPSHAKIDSQSPVTDKSYPTNVPETIAPLPVETILRAVNTVDSLTNNNAPSDALERISGLLISSSEQASEGGKGPTQGQEGKPFSSYTGSGIKPYHPKETVSSGQTKETGGADIELILETLITRVESLKRYPYLAMRKGIEGIVLLKVVINDRGELVHIFIKNSSGYEILDRDAVSLVQRACSNFKFKTGRILEIELPIKYSLREL